MLYFFKSEKVFRDFVLFLEKFRRSLSYFSVDLVLFFGLFFFQLVRISATSANIFQKFVQCLGKFLTNRARHWTEF